MGKQHRYQLEIEWTGNRGGGTTSYREYDRDHIIRIQGKNDLPASADPAFRGDPSKYNPEDLLVAAISGCHMLWYLHLCASAGIVVMKYVDRPEGIMEEDPANGGRFRLVTLHPEISLLDISRKEEADRLHTEAHRQCFISNSCNFEIRHEASYTPAN
jgi:organic hydroperoxide reductase OsmC/OhrA